MAKTFTPATYPRRSKQPNLFSEIRYYVQLWYFRYECTTGLYVMTENEKMVFNLIVLSFLGLLFSACYFYLPATVAMASGRLTYYWTGTHVIKVGGLRASDALDLAQEVLAQQDQEAVASLAGQLVGAAGDATATMTTILAVP